jgi:Protein of unknown function (DUF3592)
MSPSLTSPRIAPLRWVLLAVLAALGAIACTGSLVTGIRAQSWVETKARMIRCEVVQNSEPVDELVVLYQYAVGGQTHFGSRFGFMDGKSRKEWAADYKPGFEVTCFVNPKDATEAILRRDMALTHWLLPGIFAIAAAGLGYGAKRALIQKRIADAATLYTLESAVTGRRTRRRRAA